MNLLQRRAAAAREAAALERKSRWLKADVISRLVDLGYTEPHHTDWATWRDCPRKFGERFVRRTKDERAKPLYFLLGSMFHVAMERPEDELKSEGSDFMWWKEVANEVLAHPRNQGQQFQTFSGSPLDGKELRALCQKLTMADLYQSTSLNLVVYNLKVACRKAGWEIVQTEAEWEHRQGPIRFVGTGDIVLFNRKMNRYRLLDCVLDQGLVDNRQHFLRLRLGGG